MLSSAGEDGFEFFGSHDLKLREGAGSWFAVRAPATEVRHVTEVSTLHVLVGDLDDQFGTKRFPGEVFSLTPAAFPAGHAVFARGVGAFGFFPVFPWVIAQGIFAIRR